MISQFIIPDLFQLKGGLQQTGTFDSLFDSSQPHTPMSLTPRMAPTPYDPLAKPHRQDSHSSKSSYYPSHHWSRQVRTLISSVR